MTDNALVHLDKNKPQRAIRKFLSKLYAEESGIVATATKTKDKEWKEQYHQWPDDKEIIVEFLAQESLTKDTYVCPSLLQGEGSTKDLFKTTQHVWVEFDGNAPPAEKLREVNIPDPSIKIRSSDTGHEHWYWQLDSFMTDPEIVENISQRLAYYFQADLSGWDCVQFLRPPATIHHDTGKQVKVLVYKDSLCNALTFNDVPEIPQVASDLQIDTAKKVNLNDVLLKYSFHDDMRDLFMKNKVAQGSRDQAMTKLVFYCIETGMSPEETLAVLYNADDRWGKFVNRRDREKRLTSIIRYALSRKSPVAEEDEDEFERLPVQGVFDFLNRTDLEVEWLVENFIPKQSMMIIGGPSGAGKTLTTVQLSTSLALGKKFLDWNITRPFKMLVISMEMSQWEFLIRLREMMQGFTAEEQATLNEYMKVVPLGHGVNLMTHLGRKQVEDAIEDAIKEGKPFDGICFDSLGSIFGEDLKDDSVRKPLEHIKRSIIKKYNMFAWLIHHVTKDTGTSKSKKPVVEDLYGSTYIRNHASVIIGMWKPNDSENRFEIYPMKSWFGPSWDSKFVTIKSEPRLQLELTEARLPNSNRVRDDIGLTDDDDDEIPSFFRPH